VTGNKSGVPTGFYKIDRLTNGWQNSDLIILAGRPGMGKTASAVSMIVYPAVHLKIPVAIFSCEMSQEQLVGRLQSSVSGVNVSNVVKKQLSLVDIEQIEATCAALKEAPIFIDDTANISVIELRAKARRLVKEHGVKLIVVDYLQLMRSGIKTNNREQEIAEISKGLKAIAKELNIPVIALSQLSRSVETRGAEKKPQLSDLRESGQIEQDADLVLFCWRPEYYGIHEYELDGVEFDTSGLFLLIVSKHRNGGLGEIPLSFIKSQAKITDYNENSFPHNIVANENSSMFVQQSETGNGALEKARGNDWLTDSDNNQNTY
jgi:replicative DNA helicase